MATDWDKNGNTGQTERCNLNRPTCHKCQRAWPWPRNVAYVNEDPGPPKHIEPSTQETVVAVRSGITPMSTTIFEKLELTHCRRIRHDKFDTLVDEFEYSQSGDVCYNPPSQSKEGYHYARLVTLNTWYIALFQSLINVAFSVLDQYGNALFAIALYTDAAHAGFHTSKHGFLFGWLAMIAISLFFASRLALREWGVQASCSVGDLIESCNWVGRVRTYLAMVFFTFFSVPNTVKDVVIRLHPWKSIQPFAAIKVNGARAFAIGYKDKCLYEVENRIGQFFPLLITQALKTSIFMYKVYIVIFTGTWILVASCAVSVFSVVLGWYIWQRLWSDRRKLRRMLLEIIWSEPNLGESERSKRQRKAAEKLLHLHFGEKIWSTSSRRWHWRRTTTRFDEEDSIKGMRTFSKCTGCGRSSPTSESDARATWTWSSLATRRPHETRGRPHESNRQPHIKGGMVRLAQHFAKYSDAKYGPLRPGGVGRIVEVGPEINHGAGRCLVEVDAGGPQKHRHWYDDGAIARVGDANAVSPMPTQEDSPAIAATVIGIGDTEDDALMREFADVLKRVQQRPPESQQQLRQACKAMLEEPSAPGAVRTSA